MCWLWLATLMIGCLYENLGETEETDIFYITIRWTPCIKRRIMLKMSIFDRLPSCFVLRIKLCLSVLGIKGSKVCSILNLIIEYNHLWCDKSLEAIVCYPKVEENHAFICSKMRYFVCQLLVLKLCWAVIRCQTFLVLLDEIHPL